MDEHDDIDVPDGLPEVPHPAIEKIRTATFFVNAGFTRPHYRERSLTILEGLFRYCNQVGWPVEVDSKGIAIVIDGTRVPITISERIDLGPGRLQIECDRGRSGRCVDGKITPLDYQLDKFVGMLRAKASELAERERRLAEFDEKYREGSYRAKIETAVEQSPEIWLRYKSLKDTIAYAEAQLASASVSDDNRQLFTDWLHQAKQTLIEWEPLRVVAATIRALEAQDPTYLRLSQSNRKRRE